MAEPKARDPDLWRFAAARAASPGAERRAQQLIAVSFYAIAIYIAVDAVRALATGEHPHVSWVGIGLSAVTLATVPPLAIAKARVAEALGSSATKSESRQTMLCAYLSAAPLVGLGLNAIAGWWWADPITALIIAAVAVKEGRSSWRGESCCTAPVACAADTPACEDECCSPAATASRCAAGLPDADGASRSIDGAFATTRRASLGRRYASPSPGPAQPSGRAETAASLGVISESRVFGLEEVIRPVPELGLCQFQHHLAVEDLGVERAGPRNVPYGDEQGDDEPLARGR